jgi:hypothetical protein
MRRLSCRAEEVTSRLGNRLLECEPLASRDARLRAPSWGGLRSTSLLLANPWTVLPPDESNNQRHQTPTEAPLPNISRQQQRQAVLSPDSTTSDGALLSSARRPGRRGGHHPARPGDEVFGACLGKEVNTLDGPQDSSHWPPLSKGTLPAPWCKSPSRYPTSRLVLDSTNHQQVLTDACVLLYGHIGCPGAAGTGLHRRARQAAPAGSLRRGARLHGELPGRA